MVDDWTVPKSVYAERRFLFLPLFQRWYWCSELSVHWHSFYFIAVELVFWNSFASSKLYAPFFSTTLYLWRYIPVGCCVRHIRKAWNCFHQLPSSLLPWEQNGILWLHLLNACFIPYPCLPLLRYVACMNLDISEEIGVDKDWCAVCVGQFVIMGNILQLC